MTVPSEEDLKGNILTCIVVRNSFSLLFTCACSLVGRFLHFEYHAGQVGCSCGEELRRVRANLGF